MSNPYGPSKGELWFRLAIGIAGLCFMGFAVWFRGIPDGPALVEVIGLGGVFFGGSVVWSGLQLWQQRNN